jgi:glycosyltransferase involved in cell wall biosynthesis
MYGLFVRRHARAAAAYCDIGVLYICPDPFIGKSKYEIEEKNAAGTPEVTVYYRPASNRYKLLKSYINGIRYLLAFIKGYKHILKSFGKPDLIHVNILTRAAIPALYLKIFRDIPYIITEHWSRYQPGVATYKGLIRKIITRIIVRKADALLVITENLRKAMAAHKLTNKRTSIINNVVNTEVFIPGPAEKENSSFRLIHISCFEDRSKNLSGILRAIKYLTTIRQDFVVHLAGDGVDKALIENLSVELELKDRYVVFDGLLRETEVAEAISKSHLLIMFSNYENMPVVINEALSCGKPVVSSDVGGISEMMDNSCGVLVNPGDEKSFARAISYVLDNHQKYYPVNLRTKIIDKYSMAVVGKELSDLYSEIIKLRDND